MVSSAFADIAWLQDRLVLAPPAGARFASGQFQFLNRGSKPIRISSVQSSCGCTAVAMDSENVLPGARGTVQVTYHVGDRRGIQTVTVTVTAEEPEVRTYNLVVEARLKDFAVVAPNVQTWRVGEEPTPKFLRVTLVDGFTFVRAESTTPEFSVEVVRAQDGAVELKVVPRDLWAKRTGSIRIKLANVADSTLAEITAELRVL